MRNFIFILYIFLCISCNKQKEVFIIDLDKNIRSKNIHFNEWADDIKWIPLETNEDILLGGDTEFYITYKYILTIDRNSIHQFDLEGNYIRRLASGGKGPNEYNHILSYTVDEEKDIFYFVNSNDIQSINCINLKTGQFNEKINIKPYSYPSSIIVQNGNLICFEGYMYQKDTSYIYTLSPQGEVIESTKEIVGNEGKIINHPRQTSKIIRGKDNFIEYNKRDTVYRLNTPISEKLFVLNYQNKFEEDINNDGIYIDIPFQTSEEYIIIKHNFILTKFNDGGFNLGSKKTDDFYVLNKRDYTPAKISDFYLFPSENISYSIRDLDISGNVIFTAINAYKFKEIYEKLVEEDKNTYPEMERLYNQLNDEDNPIVVIGKLK